MSSKAQMHHNEKTSSTLPTPTPTIERGGAAQAQSLPAVLDTTLLTPNAMRQLQRTLGNQAAGKFLAGVRPRLASQAMLTGGPAIAQRTNSPSVIQREKFIGDQAKHHLHVEINLDHYKFGNDKGSRIELGKDGVYKLDQLIACRNYLVANSGGSGHAACVEWLERECREHASWDEGVGFVPSWEQEAAEENPHVDGILEHGAEVGFKRDDFENAFIQAKDEVYEEVTQKMSYYTAGTTEENIQDEIDTVELKDILASWSGFDKSVFAKDELTTHLKSAVRDHIRSMLFDTFPLSSNKYIDSYNGVKVDEEE